MVTAPTATIDACVLYSAPIRDLVVHLAQAGLLQARWSDEIHEEWMRNLLKNNPRVSRERLGHRVPHGRGYPRLSRITRRGRSAGQGGYQPNAPARVGRLFPRFARRLVFVTFFHAGVITGHSQLVDSLTLPDPDDRHVLAAAIHSGAGLILQPQPHGLPSRIRGPARRGGLSPR